MYSPLCYVEADISRVTESLSPLRSRRQTYYKTELDIILSFGLTELTAHISWMENVSLMFLGYFLNTLFMDFTM